MLRSLVNKVARASSTLVKPGTDVVSAPGGITLSIWLDDGPVTWISAENVQVPGIATVPAGMVAPEMETVPEPATAATVPDAHVVDAFGGVATTIVQPPPVGSVSVNAAAVCATADLLLSSTVSRVRPPAAPSTKLLKVFFTPTGERMAIGAVAAAGFVTPCVVVTFDIGIVLIGLIGETGAGAVLLYAPALLPVSAIENQQPVVYQAGVVVPLADIALVVQPE